MAGKQLQIDEEEYMRLRREHGEYAASKIALDRLGKNPKTRLPLLRMMKEDNPTLVIPEIDAAAPVVAELGKTREELAALTKKLSDKEEADAKKQRDAEVDGRIESGRAMLRKLGYNDDGVKGVEALMQQKGIFDYEAAEALFERTQQQPESFIPGNNFGRDSGLFDPPAESPWLEALKWKGSKGAQGKAISRVANKEVSQWFADREAGKLLDEGIAPRGQQRRRRA
jgi:hypothetical protein